MKTKKVFLATTALLAIIVLSSFVAGVRNGFPRFLGRSPETRANIVTGIMKNKLSLNESQVEKTYQVNLKYAKMFQPYIGSEEISSETKDKLIKLNTERKKELMILLTPEQTEEVKVIRKKVIERLEAILEHMKANDVSSQ